MAANYLPAISVHLPHQQAALAEIMRRGTLSKSSAVPQDDPRASVGLIAGNLYPFQLVLTNPLYDPVQVKLAVPRVHVATSGAGAGDRSRRPPFTLTMYTSSFPIAAYAEAWEFEDDDEDMMGVDGEEYPDIVSTSHGRGKETKTKVKTIGVLDRKANVTVIGGEVLITKEARGEVKVRSWWGQLKLFC
jgi:dynactin 4